MESGDSARPKRALTRKCKNTEQEEEITILENAQHASTTTSTTLNQENHREQGVDPQAVGQPIADLHNEVQHTVKSMMHDIAHMNAENTDHMRHEMTQTMKMIMSEVSQMNTTNAAMVRDLVDGLKHNQSQPTPRQSISAYPRTQESSSDEEELTPLNDNGPNQNSRSAAKKLHDIAHINAEHTDHMRHEMTQTMKMIMNEVSQMNTTNAAMVRDLVAGLKHNQSQPTPRQSTSAHQGAHESSSEEEEVTPQHDNGPNQNSRSAANKLPPFTGQERWEVWFNRFSDIARLQGWNNQRKLEEVLPRLRGTAGEFVYGQLNHADRTNYHQLISELDSRFRVVETKKTFQAQFSNRTQKPGESPEAYTAELKQLYDKAYANRDKQTRQEDLLRRFLDGLNDERIRFHVEYIKEPNNIDQAVSEVVHFQETKRRPTNKEGRESWNRNSTRMVKMTRPSDDDDSDDEEYELHEGSHRVARIPKKTGRTKLITKDPASSDTETNNSVATITQTDTVADQPDQISNCDKLMNVMEKMEQRLGQMENFIQRSTKPNRPEFQTSGRGRPNVNRPNNRTTTPPTRSYQNYVCFKCNQEGHIARGCPNVPHDTGRMPVAAQHPRTMIRPDESRIDNTTSNNNKFNTNSTN